MSEVQPPEDLPGLELVPDTGRDIHAELRAQAMANGEDMSGLSLVPDKGRDMAATMAAMDRLNGAPVSLPIPEAPMPTLVPMVGGRQTEYQNPVDAIEAEVAKINAMTPEIPAPLSVPEKPSEPAYGSAEYFAQRNAAEEEARKKFSLNPFTRAGNLVGGVAKKIGDGMAKLGEGIENAEYERAVNELLAKRTPSEVLRDRYDTFNRWNGAPAVSPKQEAAAPEKVVPVPVAVSEAPNIPPASGPAEEKAREVWGMTPASESWTETESVESLAELAREIQLQEEELKIQEEELALRRKKLLLLQKKKAFEASKKKNPPFPPKGPASAARTA